MNVAASISSKCYSILWEVPFEIPVRASNVWLLKCVMKCLHELWLSLCGFPPALAKQACYPVVTVNTCIHAKFPWTPAYTQLIPSHCRAICQQTHHSKERDQNSTTRSHFLQDNRSLLQTDSMMDLIPGCISTFHFSSSSGQVCQRAIDCCLTRLN